MPSEHADQDGRSVSEVNENFAYQWNRYGTLHDRNREELWDFLSLSLDERFTDEVVLDAGCGSGRFTVFPAQLSARAVVGLDASGAVKKAAQTTAGLRNVLIIRGDIANPPLAPVVDTVFSIGVVHHMADPFQGIRALCQPLRSGGRLLLWVYALEGNELYEALVDPIRRHVTRKLPVRIVDVLSYGFAVIQWAMIKTLYRSRLSATLPMSEYFRYLREFDFTTQRVNILDKLSPKYCHLFTRNELEGLLDSIGMKVELIRHRNGNGWTVHARKP